MSNTWKTKKFSLDYIVYCSRDDENWVNYRELAKIQLTRAFCFFSLCLSVTGGAFDGIVEEKTPFGYKRGEGIDAGYGEVDWICARDRARTDPIFLTLNPIDGKITGESKSMRMMVLINGLIINKSWLPRFSPSILCCRCQVGDGQVKAAERDAGQDLEAGGRGHGRKVGHG